MRIVLGQVKEMDGKFTMARCVELPEEELDKDTPMTVAKGILYRAYMQLRSMEEAAEIAELEKLNS